ncbi:MAG: OmpH family outer membrane protein [Weeksellaceae bacterium]
MNKLFLSLLFFGIILPIQAQRFGYVDSDYILENLPQYQQAQSSLEQQTQHWNQEILNRQEALNKRQADFLNEKVLLTDEQIKNEQAEIDAEQREIKLLQEKRYGQNGDLINLRKSLVKPIQDQVWAAVKQVAEKRNYGFIFDKGSNLIMVYTDPKFDISREVLLQLNPGALDNKTNNRSTPPANNRRTTTNTNTNSRGNTTNTRQSQTPVKQGATQSRGQNSIKK